MRLDPHMCAHYGSNEDFLYQHYWKCCRTKRTMHVLRIVVIIICVDPILSGLIASQLFFFIFATSIDVNEFCRHEHCLLDNAATSMQLHSIGKKYQNIKGTHTEC